MKNNQYVGKLTIALTMVLVSMFAVVTATFAWFNVVNTPEIGNISMGVDEGNEVLFSLDGVNWSNEITGEQIYRQLGITSGHKFSNVTPVVGSQDSSYFFTPTFKKLKYTPASLGSLGGSYSLVDAVANEDYLQVQIYVKSDVATNLYLYDLFATVDSAQNNVQAKNMVRVGYSSAVSVSAQMNVFNPSTTSTSASAYEKSGMGFGDFYSESNISNEFPKLVSSSLISKKEAGLACSNNTLTDGTRKVTVSVTTPNIANATFAVSAPSIGATEEALGTTVYTSNGEVYVVVNKEASSTGEREWSKLSDVTYNTSRVVTSVNTVPNTSGHSEDYLWNITDSKLYTKQVSYATGSAVESYVEASYVYYTLGTPNVYTAINTSYATKLATISTDQQAPTVSNLSANPTVISTISDGTSTVSSFYVSIWFEGWSGHSTTLAENGSFAVSMRFIGDRA